MVLCKICNINLIKKSYDEHFKTKTHTQKLKRYVDKFDNDYNNDFYFNEHLVRDGIITRDEYFFNNFLSGLHKYYPEDLEKELINKL